MKQGRSVTNVSAPKREPIPTAISPGAVSEIGIHGVRTIAQPLHEGRGYKAPAIESSTSNCGSQGKH